MFLLQELQELESDDKNKDQNDAITIEQCMQLFTQRETLSEKNLWFIDKLSIFN